MKLNKKRSLYTYRQDYSDLINFLKQYDEKDSTTNNKDSKGSNTSA